MITYQDFFLFCTFIVALISLIYQILGEKDSRCYHHSNGWPHKGLSTTQ